MLRPWSCVYFQLIAIGVEEVGLRAPEHAGVAIFYIEHFDAMLTQMVDGGMELFGLYPERVVDRGALVGVVFERLVTLRQNQVVVARAQEYHARRLHDDLPVKHPFVKCPATIQLGYRQTEMQHALSL